MVGELLAYLTKTKFGLEIKKFTESGDDKFSKRRVNIEIILMRVIARDKFAKMDFVEDGFVWLAEEYKMSQESQRNEDNKTCFLRH